ncbi:MAG: Jag N-terminal domain-containing protein [Oscillibacter sp.]|nr:Jag N-terminal domain-containing protein [Oscillibacter sp.]
MIKWIETTGRSEEDAIAAALFQLGLDRDDVSVEVIERAKSGFLGFGGNPAKVRVSYEVADETAAPAPIVKEEPVIKAEPKVEAKPVEEKKSAPVVEETILKAAPKAAKAEPKKAPKAEAKLQPGDEVIIAKEKAAPAPSTKLTAAADDDAKAARIREFLAGLMENMNVEATPEIHVTEEGNYKVILQGQGLGAIIGRRGETLDAIQQLTNYAVNHGQSKRVRIHIDAENYRAKREESLQRLAVKVAGKVVKYRKNVTLEAMNAYERHVIHTALQDYVGVTTYSTGTEPNRRTVVAYDSTKR